MVRYFAVVTNNAYLCIVVYKIVRIMCTRERELYRMAYSKPDGRIVWKRQNGCGSPYKKHI